MGNAGERPTSVCGLGLHISPSSQDGGDFFVPASLGKICLGKVCPLCAFKFAPRFVMHINVIKYSPSALAAIETALSIIQNRCACTIYETRSASANAGDILDQVDIIRMGIDDMQAKSLLPNSPGATRDPLSDEEWNAKLDLELSTGGAF